MKKNGRKETDSLKISIEWRAFVSRHKNIFRYQIKLSIPLRKCFKITVYKQTLEQNGIHSPADADILHEQADQLNQKISALKENLEGCRQRYDVYADIAETYREITERDYIGKLIGEEKRRREQDKKKRGKKL